MKSSKKNELFGFGKGWGTIIFLIMFAIALGESANFTTSLPAAVWICSEYYELCFFSKFAGAEYPFP